MEPILDSEMPEATYDSNYRTIPHTSLYRHDEFEGIYGGYVDYTNTNYEADAPDLDNFFESRKETKPELAFFVLLKYLPFYNNLSKH